MIPENRINYYMEPVEIEIYFKKAGTVKTIIKELFIELIDPVPGFPTAERIFTFYREQDQPIDIIDAQNNFPEIILPVTNSYFHHMDLYDKLSYHIQTGLAGSHDGWRQALYFTELLMKFEPSLASLEHIGDFHTYNLNYLIRKMNSLNEQFLLEDSTVMYLITRQRKAHEDDPPDKEFDKLVELWQYNIKEKLF